MSLGARLKKAIEDAGLTIREFHRQMEARGVSGSSYPNIHRYLADRGEPTLAFLRGAAEFLDVRLAWLVTGEESASFYQLLQLGRVEITGPADEVARFEEIADIAENYPNLPPGGKEIIMRFLLDATEGWKGPEGSWPEGEWVLEELKRLAAVFDPDPVPGNRGVMMAEILARAQVAYLREFTKGKEE